MACLASFCPSSLQRPTAHFTILSHNDNNIHIHTGTGKLKQKRGVTCSNNKEQLRRGEENWHWRRASWNWSQEEANFSWNDDEIFQRVSIYTDGENKFKILIPAVELNHMWRVGVGGGDPNGFKSVTAFYPDQNTSSNVSVIIMGLGPDFTKMESFGKVDEFAETLASGLDRSRQRPPGVAAKLINCFYYIDYSLQNPGESREFLFSVLGMASNGWYNRPYAVTGQVSCQTSHVCTLKRGLDNYGSMIEQVELTSSASRDCSPR